jgi:isoamylase
MLHELPPPIGVHWSKDQTTIAVTTDMSTSAVYLCVFDDDGTEERYPLPYRLGSTWWGVRSDLLPGMRYGFRVDGPNHNVEKFLVDPYARAVEGAIDWTTKPGIFLASDPQDSAPYVPRSIVVDPVFDWEGDVGLRRPWTETIIYEVHVKGATKTHPEVPEHLRGTYAGLAHPAFVSHLQTLGISAVELLPVQQIGHEERLAKLGLTNYWGYNSLGYFAPHDAYSASGTSGQQVAEFKGMVKLLHRAGIEVILDVVYNHTPEGGRGGAVLSQRGLAQESWYRPFDVTGCGNTVDAGDPDALRLIMDSLRYWVEEMHVDGFRFDLATALARDEDGSFDRRSVFLSAVAQDPVLRNVKLIAEPWDVGHGGYQVGEFPAPWAEWNDRFRDLVRDYWRGAPTSLGEVAHRLCASSDFFERNGRRQPWASVNFVTAHDGFCLRDLVSFNDKHNDANGENNRDGTNDNRSWNCGVEGDTDNHEVLALRRRQQRNMLAMLLLAQGTPMLVAGDEISRTQSGNNNAYCQDSPLSWIDWSSIDEELFDFTSRLIALRQTSRLLCSEDWLNESDASWFAPDGALMTIDRWNDQSTNGLGMLLVDSNEEHRNERRTMEALFVAMNEGPDALTFVLPTGNWELALTTDNTAVVDTHSVKLCDRSLAVFRRGM